ncbi:MAG: asparagine--tRNA ligase [Bianqueaceae bacterium]
MSYTLIKDLYAHAESFAGQSITVSGWVRSIRDSKSLGFLVLHDGTCFATLQIVYEEGTISNFQEISRLPVGSAVIVTGEVVLTPNAKQPFELRAASIDIEGSSTPDYPLQKKRHSFEYLRTIAHLRPRSNTFQAVFRVRSLAAYAIHQFFQDRGFVYVHTPLITGSDCEGAGEMFQVTTQNLAHYPLTDHGALDYSQDFFGKPANLTVSGCSAPRLTRPPFGMCTPLAPFRAGSIRPGTAEFWMIEPEISFADLQDDMQLAEDMLKYVIRYLMDRAADSGFFNSFVGKTLLQRLTHIVNSDFARCTYTDAIEHLNKADRPFEYKPEWGCDLQTEHERYLTEVVFGRPVFVTDYPKDIKAFYMRMNEDTRTVAAMDLLVAGVGELIGGSQREERLDMLLARMEELKLDPENYWWYLDLRRYGTNRHAGFGLGFERLIMYVTGMANIRDVLPFPRTVNNLDF